MVTQITFSPNWLLHYFFSEHMYMYVNILICCITKKLDDNRLTVIVSFKIAKILKYYMQTVYVSG